MRGGSCARPWWHVSLTIAARSHDYTAAPSEIEKMIETAMTLPATVPVLAIDTPWWHEHRPVKLELRRDDTQRFVRWF